MKGILVNIFGGIMKCDIIADGIVAAAKEVNLSVPLVVRLEGTNVEQGKDILANSRPADRFGQRSGRCRQQDRGRSAQGRLSERLRTVRSASSNRALLIAAGLDSSVPLAIVRHSAALDVT